MKKTQTTVLKPVVNIYLSTVCQRLRKNGRSHKLCSYIHHHVAGLVEERGATVDAILRLLCRERNHDVDAEQLQNSLAYIYTCGTNFHVTQTQQCVQIN